jgi:hypothetical protein
MKLGDAHQSTQVIFVMRNEGAINVSGEIERGGGMLAREETVRLRVGVAGLGSAVALAGMIHFFTTP